jgi:hypothetical protein
MTEEKPTDTVSLHCSVTSGHDRIESGPFDLDCGCGGFVTQIGSEHAALEECHVPSDVQSFE